MKYTVKFKDGKTKTAFAPDVYQVRRQVIEWEGHEVAGEIDQIVLEEGE